jgi:hypothetical protein
MLVIDYWPLSGGGYSTPPGLTNITAIAAGRGHTVALRQDGTVTSWGYANYGLTNVPAGLSNVVAVAAGDYHTLALKSDGTLMAWGDDTYGQLLIPPGLSNVTAIAATANNSLALKNDGTVVGWGNNSSGQLNVPAGLSNVQAIAAGVYNGFALKADGTVVQWGNGPVWQQNGVNTQLVVAAGMSNVTAIAAAGYTAWSLHSDGTLRGWGLSPFLPYPNFPAAAIAAGNGGGPGNDYLLALAYDGSVSVTPGFMSSQPFLPFGPIGAVAIAAGSYGHAAVLINDGTPRVAGRLVNQTVYSGSTAVFASGIVGAAPLSYQWQFNGTNLPGATNALLVLTNVPLSAAGSYSCLATNSIGAATNSSATLTVLRSTPMLDGLSLSLTGSGFSLRLGQLSGYGSSVILASTNLLDWVPIFTNPPSLGSIQFLDSSATNSPARFYRAVEY